jgi:hypothetical protein
MGFKDVVLLDGGVTKWKEDGYELKKWLNLVSAWLILLSTHSFISLK